MPERRAPDTEESGPSLGQRIGPPYTFRPRAIRTHVPQPASGAGGPVFIGLLFGALVYIGVFFVRSRRAETTTPALACEVRRITLAFDWSARAALQEALATIAEAADFSTAGGMMNGATRTVHLLAEHIGAARYGVYDREYGDAGWAEGVFHRRTVVLRARFTDELVRNRERQDEPELRAGAHEGEGFVTVSVVTGTTVHLDALAAVPTPEAFVHALLAVTGADPEQLVAFEVIWSPAAEDDRMSSHELETLYPELLRLDDDPGIGKVQCTHCAAPYPAEIGLCPVCGAPRPSSVASA